MAVIEGKELRPCGELSTWDTNDGYINLMTYCDRPRFQLGCLDGRGNCSGYYLVKRISKEIRGIASLIEARKQITGGK